MNRITKLFSERQGNILSVYFTAGYPQLNDTVSIIRELEIAGADLIEIGMPFSDPLADGPVIQQSSEIALNNGMNIGLLFEQLKELRQQVQIPLILMGYLNPVMQFGVEAFCKKAAETGIDGIILPDLPYREFVLEYKQLFEKHGLFNIFLITPQTSNDRIRMIDKASEGFIYMVSSSSTTGTKGEFDSNQIEYFRRVDEMKLKNHRLIGFGISNHKTFTQACSHSDGAIIGSAFIKALSQPGDIKESVHKFVKEIRSDNHISH